MTGYKVHRGTNLYRHLTTNCASARQLARDDTTSHTNNAAVPVQGQRALNFVGSIVQSIYGLTRFQDEVLQKDLNQECIICFESLTKGITWFIFNC